MTMRRFWLHAFFLAGGLSAAGCTDHGTYTVTWSFSTGEGAGAGCGAHGVNTIRVTGSSTKGDGDDVVTLCAGIARMPDGKFTHEVPVGDWTFAFHQLDVRGRPIVLLDDQGQPIPDQTATAAVVAGQSTDVDPNPIVFTPRPECSDGIDNDSDGRIDLDDSGCMGDPSTALECADPAAGC